MATGHPGRRWTRGDEAWPGYTWPGHDEAPADDAAPEPADEPS